MRTTKADIHDLNGDFVGCVWQEDDGSWCWRTGNSRGFGNRQERQTAIKALMDAHLVLSGLPQLPRRIVDDKPKRTRTVVEQADDLLRAERLERNQRDYAREVVKEFMPPRRVFAMPPSSNEPLGEHDAAALKDMASGIGAMLDRAKQRGGS